MQDTDCGPGEDPIESLEEGRAGYEIQGTVEQLFPDTRTIRVFDGTGSALMDYPPTEPSEGQCVSCRVLVRGPVIGSDRPNFYDVTVMSWDV